MQSRHKKRTEKTIVVTNVHGIQMKGKTIRGKVDGKYGGIYSLTKHMEFKHKTL